MDDTCIQDTFSAGNPSRVGLNLDSNIGDMDIKGMDIEESDGVSNRESFQIHEDHSKVKQMGTYGATLDMDTNGNFSTQETEFNLDDQSESNSKDSEDPENLHTIQRGGRLNEEDLPSDDSESDPDSDNDEAVILDSSFNYKESK
jgi:hypothetical protein